MNIVLLLTLLIPFALIAFWAWMFHDMVNNPDIPQSTTEPFRWPPQAKNYWLIVFIFLNIVAAGYYYFTVYRER
jgi:hypothetical protein